MKEVSKDKINAGESPEAACDEAFRETKAEVPDGVGRRTSNTDAQLIDICMDAANELPVVQQARDETQRAAQAAWDADAPNREQIEREKAQAANEAAAAKAAKEEEAARITAQEVADVRAGRREQKDFEQAVQAVNAQPGASIANSPKVRADGKLYYAYGTLEKPDGQSASFVALTRSDVTANPLYIYVEVPKKLEEKYYAAASVGHGFGVVGTYKSNMEYRTVMGERKVMPVFVAQSKILVSRRAGDSGPRMKVRGSTMSSPAGSCATSEAQSIARHGGYLANGSTC
ncbi:hypothetical protein [Paraburkholderia sp. MM5477-R1]|uniref:hypothetical protein n=1 Tax=Paraburkholderia sp. MM5477-R1 TaxID=2991062 RepID=UPI003D19504C